MNTKRTATVFKDLAETLHYIHNKGLLHNDLKTNNVIMHCGEKGDFFPIIIDFGKSKYQGMYRDIKGQQIATTLHRKSNQVHRKAQQVTCFPLEKCLRRQLLDEGFTLYFQVLL